MLHYPRMAIKRSHPLTSHLIHSRANKATCYGCKASLIARFMGPTWGPSGADRTQVGPMMVPWTLLSGIQFPTAIYCNAESDVSRSHHHGENPPMCPDPVCNWLATETRTRILLWIFHSKIIQSKRWELVLFKLHDGFIRILAGDNQGSCYLITYIWWWKPHCHWEHSFHMKAVLPMVLRLWKHCK